MWARVDGGRVQEITDLDPAGRFHPSLIWAPCTSTTNVLDAAVQVGGVWTFTPPAAPPAPTLAQQAAAALSAGLSISLSGSLTLAATLFPTDAATQAKLNAVVTVLGATGAFPDGATSYPMKDASGASNPWHTFTAAQYKAVAGAIASYVAALFLIADGNPFSASALPPASATIAV